MQTPKDHHGGFAVAVFGFNRGILKAGTQKRSKRIPIFQFGRQRLSVAIR